MRTSRVLPLVIAAAICQLFPGPAGAADVVLYASTSEKMTGGPGKIYRIDPDTQTVTLVAVGPFGDSRCDASNISHRSASDVGDLDFDSGGRLYGITGGSIGPSCLFTLDLATGTASILGVIPVADDSGDGVGVSGLAFDHDGTLYASAWSDTIGNGLLLTLDPANGNALTTLQTFGATGNNWVAGLTIDPNGQMFGSRGNAGGHLEDLVLVDKATAQLTPIGPGTQVISDVWFAPDGRLFGCSPNGDLFVIDPATGMKTLLFNTGLRLAGLTGVVDVITVAIDIRPDSFENVINLRSRGVVPVAILSSATFDATSVNPLTVQFANAAVRIRGNGTPAAINTDVNADGLLDTVLQFDVEAIDLPSGSTEASLSGETFDGIKFEGRDSVTLVP